MKSVRILKICGIHYDQLIRNHYRRHPELKALNYQEHKEALLNFAPVHLNNFSGCMRGLGYECSEVIYDLETLQKTWAKEYGFDYSESQWRVDILLKQIEFYQPDVIYLQDIYSMPHFVRKRLKEYYPFLKKVVLYKGFRGAEKECKDIDFIFAGIKPMVEDYQREGIPSELVYHGFDDRVLTLLKDEDLESQYPLSFLGYSGYGHMGSFHVNRYYMLRDLSRKTDMSLWLSEDVNYKNPDLKQEDKPLQEEFKGRCQEGCFGLDMFKIFKSSEVIFNKHTDMAGGLVGNMRMFEATGVGSCLLTDTGSNIADLFEPDQEIVTYKTFDECLEKVDYLRSNPEKRQAIAKAGQKRTLRDHTLKRRCEVIHDCLQKIL